MALSSTSSLSARDAAIYFEAVIAAILATAAVGAMNPSPENLILKHKEMLQKIRSMGGPFN